MSGETVRKLLKDVGLTEKETEVYLFLAKHGALKGLEIAKQTKKHKAQIYLILKNLKSKGLAESTLEHPTRFTAVPIERVIDLHIKTKREEATSIENAKKEIMSYWKNIGQPKLEESLEKFVVIEGSNKIYAKFGQMMNETKNQFSAYLTVPDLLSAYKFGLFETPSNQPSTPKRQFRALVEFDEQELPTLKNFLGKKLIKNFDLKGKNPSLGLGISPRMAVKDEQEVILFVTKRNLTKNEQNAVCLWTNCKTLVFSFLSVFRDLWRSSHSIEDKVVEMKASQVVPRAFDIGDKEKAKHTYDKTVRSAGNEILIVTSANGLAAIARRFSFFKELVAKGVQVKILAPITTDNFNITQELLEICDVRHITADFMETTMVDGHHLFQFNDHIAKEHPGHLSHFENMTYILDYEYLKKTEVAFKGLWANALQPTNPSTEPVQDAPKLMIAPLEEKRWSEYAKVMNPSEGNIGELKEKDILNKIIMAKKKVAKTWTDPILFYGSHATAVIHPPYYFNLPNMILSIYHNNKQSSFGDEDLMIISLWLETPRGQAYIPVALVTDNSEGDSLRKKIWENTPIAKNFQIVKKDEIEVRVQGNTLFAGWTVPILLMPSKYMLPPACVLFEGYGKLVSGVTKTTVPSGRKVTTEYNGLEAFVTFFHPSSKYSGPGTDGLLARDAITTSVA